MKLPLQICFFTFDRRPGEEYIQQSVLSCTAAGAPAKWIHILVDGPSCDFLSDLPRGIARHELTALEWDIISNWSVHKRIALAYHRCFKTFDPQQSSGLLICEDDVCFRHNFPELLDQVLVEMAGDSRLHFVLSLYRAGTLDSDDTLRRGLLYGAYPGFIFYGGQAVYFSPTVVAEAREFWARNGWRDVPNPDRPNDLLIGQFGEELWERYGEDGGIYRCYSDLVQHVGDQSLTGLSGGYHFSETFHLDWGRSVKASV